MVRKKKETNPWLYNGSPVFIIPPDAIGFVYRIDVLETGQYYIGKKNLYSVSGKGKNKKVKESNWKNYSSSSKELKALIKTGKYTLRKTILEFCPTSQHLTLKETAHIICSGCLEDPMSINKWVYCRIYKQHLI